MDDILTSHSPRFSYVSYVKYNRSRAEIFLLEKYFENLSITNSKFEIF